MRKLDLPFGVGKWSGEILFHYENDFDKSKSATCYLGIVDSDKCYVAACL